MVARLLFLCCVQWTWWLLGCCQMVAIVLWLVVNALVSSCLGVLEGYFDYQWFLVHCQGIALCLCVYFFPSISEKL